MGEHIRLESVEYNLMVVEEIGSASIDPLAARRIGEGGYATTYSVLAQPGLPVAGILKVFKASPELCRAGERLRWKKEWNALYDEYGLLYRLDGLEGHAPLVYAKALFVVDDGSGWLMYSPAFLMEEVGIHAESLHEVVRRHDGPFEAEQVATFGLRMLDVLDLLAEQGGGVTHADLSPANVYVRRSPDDRTFEWVYLIDFGQAKVSDEGVTPSFVPGVCPRMGTVEYGAPELIPRFSLYEDDTAACREHNELYSLRNDPAVDLGSLGALLFLRALRRAPSYSVEYAARSYVPGFWRGNTLLKEDEAFRILIEEKHRGLGLPDYMSEEDELLLGQAIALCTAWDPRDRDRRHIRRLLSRVAEGVDDERFQQMTYVPEVTPVLADDVEQDVRVEPGTVFAGVYKLYRADGSAYSDREMDLLVFGDSVRAVNIREYRYRGAAYAAEHVGPCYDMSRVGWDMDRDDERCDSPWQGIEIVDFLTEIRPATTCAWFADCEDLTELLHIERLDTAATTDMRFMFLNCSSLEWLDVLGFDTSRVKTFACMFWNCSSLRALDVSGLDTSSATDMGGMFHGCSSLASLDVSGFRTGSVADMTNMFGDCHALRELDVSGFDTSNVMSFRDMFADCSSLRALDVSHFDTSAATNMSAMFWKCSSLRALDVSGFDCSNATDLSCMFMDCSELENIGGALRSVRDDAETCDMYHGSPNIAVPENMWGK